MKTLVVYYSRTGTTRRLARLIAEMLKADTEEIRDDCDRRGLIGYLRSARHATLKRGTAIHPVSHDPSDYDVVVVGTPVWRASLSSPVRAYLESHAKALPQVAFFCTLDGFGSSSAFEQMAKACGRRPLATIARTKRQMASADLSEVVRTFAWVVQRAEGRCHDVPECPPADAAFA